MATKADRTLLVIVAALLAIVGVATVLAATRSSQQFEDGSPAATVQDYLTAIAEHDPTAAAALLDPDGPCGLADVTGNYVPEQFRADLRSQDVSGHNATVTVQITENNEGPFGGGWSHDEQFVLIEGNGGWVLAGMPWPMGACVGTVLP